MFMESRKGGGGLDMVRWKMGVERQMLKTNW